MTLAIYCAGGLGKEVIAFCRALGRWQDIIFVDDVTTDEWYQGAKVFRFEEVKTVADDVEFIIASGEPAGRAALYQKIKAAGYPMATVIDPACTIPQGTEIGEGCIVYHCDISIDVKIGPNTFVEYRAIIGHDVKIAAHSMISARTFFGGHTSIGERVYVAPGVVLKDRITVHDDAVIGLGAVVMRNVRPKAIMVGNPAKRIGYNVEGKVFDRFSLCKA